MPSEKQRISAAIAEISEVGTIRLQVTDGEWMEFRRTWERMKKKENRALFNLDIWPWSPRRTSGPLSQNNAFHGFLRQIAYATGQSMNQVKYHVMVRAYQDMMYPGTEIEGIVLHQDDADVDQADFSKLIEMTRILAMEEQVALKEN